MTVTDSISGITGVVRGVRVFYSGCEQVLMQQKGVNPMGEAIDPRWTEIVTLNGFKKLPLTERPEILGAKVLDTITGYEGTAISVVILDNYDARVYIQGTTRTTEGIPSPEHVCDLGMVERIDKKPVKKTEATGAPAFLERARRSPMRKS